MKIIQLSLLFLLCGGMVSAQMSDDTTRIKFGNKTIIVIADEADTSVHIRNDDFDEDDNYSANDYASWAGFYFGTAGYLTENNEIDLPSGIKDFEVDYSKALNVNLNFAQVRFQLGTPHIGFTTGLGLEFNRYDFKRNIVIGGNADSIFAFYDSSTVYYKNFLKATYLQLPLLIDFTTASKRRNSLALSAGVIAGFKIGSKMKVKYYADGEKFKEVDKGDYNINPFKFSATARLTYGNIGLYANYGLNSLFQKDKGPEVYPFSVGLMFFI